MSRTSKVCFLSSYLDIYFDLEALFVYRNDDVQNEYEYEF